MLIAVEQKDRLLRGIFGQTPTATLPWIPLPTPTPTTPTIPTPAIPTIRIPIPTLTPTGGGVIIPGEITEWVRSPAVYAKHALESALIRYKSTLADQGYDRPWIRTGVQKPITAFLHGKILDYAYNWSHGSIRSYPSRYHGPVDKKSYEIRDATVRNLVTRAYLKNYLDNYYLFRVESITPTITPAITPAITPTITPTRGLPPITANVPRIVNDNLEFNEVPFTAGGVPIAGSIKAGIFDAVLNKSTIDILSVEYLSQRRSPPPGVSWNQIKERNKLAVWTYLKSVGMKRGSATQSPDFIPTTRGTSPIPYNREREWWASSDKERAQWAVRAVLSSMGIAYRRTGIMISPEQGEAVLEAAVKWLQAVASDPVFVRNAADRSDMQRAIGLISIGLLGNMGIAVTTAPVWQEKVRIAVDFWLGRTPNKTMTETEYTAYRKSVSNTAILYWKKDRDSFIRRGGVPTQVNDYSIRLHTDSLLREAITVVDDPTPTVVITPTPTVAITPTPTVAITPTPTRIMSLTEAARQGLSEAIRDGGLQDIARAKKYANFTAVFFYLPANLFDKMIVDAVIAAKRIYLTAGGDLSTFTDEQWRGQVSLVNNSAQDRRFVRDTTVVITPTPTVTPTVRRTLEELIVELFANVLPSVGLAQGYPAPYYIPDVRRQQLVEQLYKDGVTLANTEKYRLPDTFVGFLRLPVERIDQELRARNILPESDYARVAPVTPVVTGDAALKEWAKTAPIFESYQQCRAAAEGAVGVAPDRWRDCLTEADMVDQSVSQALIQRGIRPYPGSLELPEADFESAAGVALAISQQMIYQRTYTPVVGGQALQLAR